MYGVSAGSILLNNITSDLKNTRARIRATKIFCVVTY
jgi:hypothetical protein